MTPNDVLMVEHACAKLMTQYCVYVDLRSPDIVELFSDDARFIRPDAELAGKAAIAGFFASLPSVSRRHISSNVLVDVVDAWNAIGSSYVTVYSAGAPVTGLVPVLTPPYLIASYEDRFVRDGDTWKFSERCTSFWAKC